MRKGLSILLILAALFGFYGSVTSLKDVSAAISYWNEQEIKASAEMSKIEDSLYQLEDLRDDYYDGKKRLADGEKEFTDAEDKLSEGREQLDQAYADYNSAPDKLAKAKAELSKGKRQLDDAAKKLNGMRTLIKYISTVESTYESWKSGYKKADSDRSAVAKSVKSHISDLKDYEDFMTDASAKSSFDGSISMLAANDVSGAGLKNNAAEGYIGYINMAAGVCSACSKVKDTIDGMVSALSGMKSSLEACRDSRTENEGYDEDKLKDFAKGHDSELAKLGISDGIISSMKKGDGAAAKEAYEKITKDHAVYKTYQEKLHAIRANAEPALSAMSSYVKDYGTLSKGSSQYGSDKIAALAGADGGQVYMAAVMQKLADAVTDNKTMGNALKKNLGSSSMKLLKKVSKDPNFVYPYVRDKFDKGCDFEEFKEYMEDDPDLISLFSKVRSLLKKTLKTGRSGYEKGNKAYRSGLAQYRQGVEAYKSAPDKLADAESKLADGEKKLDDGTKTLEKMRNRIVEYEESEQQVRDDLADLLGTRSEGNLRSIMDRAGGDDDFDNGEERIDIDECLDDVEAGREYHSDLSKLIIKENTSRAIGTAAAFAAAIFAVAAAVLSFRGKNKGAGKLALLAAASGVFASYSGHVAGSAFTKLAGISVNNLPWVAAAVLSVIALAHAAVHFKVYRARFRTNETDTRFRKYAH